MTTQHTPEVARSKNSVRRVGVFCGSSLGHDSLYAEFAGALGLALAESGIGIVYGGGKVGLMGRVADAALAAKGEVVGVIPRSLFKPGIVHPGLTATRVSTDLLSRKRLMAELADCFLVLPGGLGTLDEALEMLTWRQLRIHEKPVALVDPDGFFNPLLDALRHMTDRGFVQAIELERLAVLGDVPAASKWVSRQCAQAAGS